MKWAFSDYPPTYAWWRHIEMVPMFSLKTFLLCFFFDSCARLMQLNSFLKNNNFLTEFSFLDQCHVTTSRTVWNVNSENHEKFRNTQTKFRFTFWNSRLVVFFLWRKTFGQWKKRARQWKKKESKPQKHFFKKVPRLIIFQKFLFSLCLHCCVALWDDCRLKAMKKKSSSVKKRIETKREFKMHSREKAVENSHSR